MQPKRVKAGQGGATAKTPGRPPSTKSSKTTNKKKAGIPSSNARNLEDQAQVPTSRSDNSQSKAIFSAKRQVGLPKKGIRTKPPPAPAPSSRPVTTQSQPPIPGDVQDLLNQLSKMDLNQYERPPRRARAKARQAPPPPPPPPPPQMTLNSHTHPDTQDIQRLLASFMAETDMFQSDDSRADGPPGYVPHVPPPPLRSANPDYLSAFAVPPFPYGYNDPINSNPWREASSAVPSPTAVLRHSMPPTEVSSDEELIDAPPPGIASSLSRIVQEASASLELERNNTAPTRHGLLKKVNPANIPQVFTAPNPSIDNAREKLQVATYQTDFPSLGEKVVPTTKVQSEEKRIRPLTSVDRSHPYPRNWCEPPRDADIEAGSLWMTHQEIDYIARQQVAQTARAQVDFTRPKTLKQDESVPPAPVAAALEKDFVVKTPPRGCICFMLKQAGQMNSHPPFATCLACKEECGADVLRGIASRVKFCYEAKEAQEILYGLLALTGPASGHLDDYKLYSARLLDVLGKENGGRKLCFDLWFMITAQGDNGRFEILRSVIRSGAVLSHICREMDRHATLSERLRQALHTAVNVRQIPRDRQSAESLSQALLYELELISIEELKSNRHQTSHWIRLGLLLILTFVDEIRNAKKCRRQQPGTDPVSSTVLMDAALIHQGILDGISEGTGRLPAQRIKDPFYDNPGLLAFVTSPLFLAIMTIVFTTPIALSVPELRPPPVLLSQVPPTLELLYRLVCLAAIQNIDYGVAVSEAKVFLKSSMYCAVQDNFCASALQEACAYSQSFLTPEDAVMWICDKK